ncbi:MAG: hypothetical protein KKA90_01370 [Nanoarchaeota archaeon]|nr:hypothetical protein [Nanoarchaeota archaeon]
MRGRFRQRRWDSTVTRALLIVALLAVIFLGTFAVGNVASDVAAGQFSLWDLFSGRAFRASPTPVGVQGFGYVFTVDGVMNSALPILDTTQLYTPEEAATSYAEALQSGTSLSFVCGPFENTNEKYCLRVLPEIQTEMVEAVLEGMRRSI